MINNHGVHVQYTTQMVCCKIKDIENLMSLAFDWMTSKTSADIQEQGGDE